MPKVERLTYANYIVIDPKHYEKTHGVIDAYGGRVKDCQYIFPLEKMIMFYEMSKANRQPFEKELYALFECIGEQCSCHNEVLTK